MSITHSGGRAVQDKPSLSGVIENSHVQNTDQFLDKDGTNQSTAKEVRDDIDFNYPSSASPPGTSEVKVKLPGGGLRVVQLDDLPGGGGGGLSFGDVWALNTLMNC